MHRSNFSTLLTLVILLLLASSTAFAGGLKTVYTNEYPPLSIQQQGKDRGLGCELLQEIDRRLNYNTKITFDLWSKAFAQALHNSDTGVFPTNITPEREPEFIWVGPFCVSEYYIYKANTKNIAINSKDDIINAKKIATVREYVINSKLKQQGCKNLVYFNTPREAIIAVILGKCDICIFPKFIVDNFHKESGYKIRTDQPIKTHNSGLSSLFDDSNGISLTYGSSYETYEDRTLKHKELGQTNAVSTKGRPDITPVDLFMRENLYFALNKHTPASIANDMQKALYQIKEDKTLTRLFAKYHIPRSSIPEIPPTPAFPHNVAKATAPAPVFTATKPLHIYAEDFTPFTFLTSGSDQVQGAGIDLVKAIQRELGDSAATPITLTDWNSAFNQARSTPFSVICALKRIPERENDFYWIGPYAADSAWLYSRRDFPQKITNIQQAKDILKIACIDQTFAHAELLAQGFKNIVSYNTPDEVVKEMLNNPEYAAAFSSAAAPYMIRNAGYSPLNVQPLIPISKKTNYYIGISKGTPQGIASSWQQAFDKLKASGEVNAIIQRWIKQP